MLQTYQSYQQLFLFAIDKLLLIGTWLQFVNHINRWTLMVSDWTGVNYGTQVCLLIVT